MSNESSQLVTPKTSRNLHRQMRQRNPRGNLGFRDSPSSRAWASFSGSSHIPARNDMFSERLLERGRWTQLTSSPFSSVQCSRTQLLVTSCSSLRQWKETSDAPFAEVGGFGQSRASPMCVPWWDWGTSRNQLDRVDPVRERRERFNERAERDELVTRCVQTQEWERLVDLTG